MGDRIIKTRSSRAAWFVTGPWSIAVRPLNAKGGALFAVVILGLPLIGILLPILLISLVGLRPESAFASCLGMVFGILSIAAIVFSRHVVQWEDFEVQSVDQQQGST